MKILSMAWTIYDSRIKEFHENYTGAGLVIKNICEYIGRKEESYLFIGKCHLPEQKIGNVTIVGTDYKLDDADNDSVRDENYLRHMTKKFELTLDKIKPDIVNFHASGVLMQYCIQVCIRKRIPYVYVDHLYIGLHKKIERYETAVEWEKSLYSIPNIPVIVVSHGMKKRILEDYPQISDSDIRVIPNGTDFIAQKIESDYVEKYHLHNKKVLLCVGTVLVRKNQMQLVDMYEKLPENIRNNLKIIFCGKDTMQGKLQERISEAELDNALIYVGAVSSDEMNKFYSIADGLIMPSLAEGLSIAALEALAYGLPVIMFSDLECADDLNDCEAVSFADNRCDESLVEAVEQWYRKSWNREYIIQYSKYFSMERVADDYINYYKDRLGL